MKKKIRTFLVVILAFLAMSANASAVPVCFTKVIPVIEVTTMDGQKKTIQSSVIQLIGRDSNGDGILFLDAQYYKVEASSLKSLFPGVDIESLPVITEFATIGGGFGEIVFPMQNALIKLGYLEGTPDGSFGPKTKKAVKEFQEDVGLKQTETVDALLQMLIYSMTESQIYVTGTTPLSVIGDRAAVNMQPIYESGLVLEYDDISGTGLISDGVAISCDASGSRDIDQYLYSIRFGLDVQEEKNGSVSITPVMLLDCLSSLSPMMESVILKSGSARCTVDVSEHSSYLDGIRSVEQAVVLLDDDCISLLGSVVENGELKIRVNGKYRDFDLFIPQEKFAAIETVGKTAAAMRK